MIRPERAPVSPELVLAVLERAKQEIERRIRHHGNGAFVGPHEIMGMVEEERREAWDEVRGNNPERLARELFDMTTAALFGVASLVATGRIEWGGSGLTIQEDHAR